MSNRIFKTPAGIELPLINLKGKEYLEVKYRLVWFREVHPDWFIETQFVDIGVDHAFCRAMISDNTGRCVSMGHKYEDKKGFADFREKAETGAIGRSLAHLGFGTQFAPELEEGERIVDSPVGNNLRPMGDSLIAGDAVVPFGKNKGIKIKTLPVDVLRNDLDYWNARIAKDGKPATGPLLSYLLAISDYLVSLPGDDEVPFDFNDDVK